MKRDVPCGPSLWTLWTPWTPVHTLEPFPPLAPHGPCGFCHVKVGIPKKLLSNEIFPYLNAFLIQRLLWSIAIPAMLRIISDRSRYHAAFPESKNGGG